MVLIGVVDIDVLGLLAADNKRRSLAGESGCFVAGVDRVGEEEADDVGNVLVGEARVLLAYPARVYDILGGCGGGDGQYNLLGKEGAHGGSGNTWLRRLGQVAVHLVCSLHERQDGGGEGRLSPRRY